MEEAVVPSTTTIGLLAVRAEPHTTIVIAILKSAGSIQLRIDQMNPKLLEIGANISENTLLMRSHNDLYNRLAEKQQQVEDLLKRTENLVDVQTEPNAIAIYDAMSKSLCLAWKELSRRLELRGYLLSDTLNLYKIAEDHQKLSNHVISLLERAQNHQEDPRSLRNYCAEIKKTYKDFIEKTADGMDISANIITQIRVLGSLADNKERPKEILESCLVIEEVMLKMAEDWEIIDNYWSIERAKFEQLLSEFPSPPEPEILAEWTKELHETEIWLNLARDRAKLIEHDQNELEVVASLQKEVKHREKALKRLSNEVQNSDFEVNTLIGRANTLLELYDLMSKKLEEQQQLIKRARTFFDDAELVLSQLRKIYTELEANADVSIARELGPLAQQKALPVIDEGQYLIERLGEGHPSVPSITKKFLELKRLTAEVVQIARDKIKQAKSEPSEGLARLNIQITNMENWIRTEFPIFLESNNDVSNSDFLAVHKKFLIEITTREHGIISIVANINKIPSSESQKFILIQQQFESLKKSFERRIQLGTLFENIMKLDKNLEGTLEKISKMLTFDGGIGNKEQTMRGLVQMAQEEIYQEFHQVDKFIVLSNEIAQEKQDPSLMVKRPTDLVQSMVDEKKALLDKIIKEWQNWERLLLERKNRCKYLIDEVELWRREMQEFVRILEHRMLQDGAVSKNWQPLLSEINSILQTTTSYYEQLSEIRPFVEQQNANEEQRQILKILFDDLTNIKNKLNQIKNDVSKFDKTGDVVDESPMEKQIAPNITGLESAEVIEGIQFKFSASVHAIPEPKVRWYRDGIELFNLPNRRMTFINRLATLCIDRTQVDDSGEYRIRAENQYGAAESWASLLVIKGGERNFLITSPRQPISNFGKELPPVMVVPSKSYKASSTTSSGASSPTKRFPPPTPPKPSTPIQTTSTHPSQTTPSEPISSFLENGQTTWQQTFENTTYQNSIAYKNSENRDSISSPPSKYDNVVDELRQTTAFGGLGKSPEQGPVGYSSIANAPEFIRPFQTDYTIEEGENAQVDCLLLGNPRPKVYWFFNDKQIKSSSEFVKFSNVGDSYMINFSNAKLENAGYYKMVAENVRGRTYSETLIHVRPQSLIPRPVSSRRSSTQRSHQGSPIKVLQRHEQGREMVLGQRACSTPPQPPYIRGSPMEFSTYGFDQQIMSASAHQSGYQRLSESPSKLTKGQPPHFIQALVSCVVNIGDEAKFDAVVTGWPTPELTWSKDGIELVPYSMPHVQWISSLGRVSMSFKLTTIKDAGKYMCTAKNTLGVATSSAQLVLRPRTQAPDFVSRLLSEEIADGQSLKWTVKISGEPEPRVTWLMNGEPITNSDRVRLIKEAPQIHSLVMKHTQMSDNGQITCYIENSAGEARSTADLIIRPKNTTPGNYIHITKISQEKQIRGEEVGGNQSLTIEPPHECL